MVASCKGAWRSHRCARLVTRLQGGERCRNSCRFGLTRAADDVYGLRKSGAEAPARSPSGCTLCPLVAHLCHTEG